MSLAIHYTAVKPLNSVTREVFGLHVAVGDWLLAYLRYGQAPRFTFLIGGESESLEIQEVAARAGVERSRLALLDRRFPEANLANLSCVFRPEPDTRNLLWQRRYYGNFAFCGLSHAISGVEAGEVLQDYCLAPSLPCDAIICPSRAVQAAIRSFWAHYADYVRSHFGGNYQCPVQTPLIPLGIDTGRVAALVSPEKRAAQRAALGIPDDECVVLWVGRLSAAIKAHPLATFRAVELAAQKLASDKAAVKIHLVMVGYFVPEDAREGFLKLAAETCTAAKVTFVASDDKRFPDGLWAAGDIFLSLIDNMQESFGLTPIEAMAAGLPRIISDWDGYRDSVTDGEDGFLIRTLQPPAGNGCDLSLQLLSGREVYGGFLAKAALTVAVDVKQAASRVVDLALSPGLRANVVARARTRLAATYDWRSVIPAYEELWDDLVARRGASPPQNKPHWPLVPDPYTMYAAYPTRSLAGENKLVLAANSDQIAALWRHPMNIYAQDILLPPGEITEVLKLLAQTMGLTGDDIMAHFPMFDRPRLWRTLTWLIKLSIVNSV